MDKLEGFAVQPRKAFRIVQSHGETAYKVAIFNRAEVEATLGPINEHTADGIISDLVPWYESNGGVGRWFNAAPAMRVMKRNVLVTQFGGLDI